MEVNSEALAAALKMAGQDTAEMEKTLRVLRMVKTIQANGLTPENMMALMAQYNPKYAAMAALMRNLQASAAAETESTAPQNPPSETNRNTEAQPFVQYNHF